MVGEPIGWVVVWGVRGEQHSLHLDHVRALQAACDHHGQLDHLVRGSDVAVMLQAAREEGYIEGARNAARQPNDAI